MRLPRNLSGKELANALKALDYSTVRQTGSHIRLTTSNGGEHHITIPAHDALRVGTLNSILNDVASHFELTRDELLKKILS